MEPQLTLEPVILCQEWLSIHQKYCLSIENKQFLGRMVVYHKCPGVTRNQKLVEILKKAQPKEQICAKLSVMVEYKQKDIKNYLFII